MSYSFIFHFPLDLGLSLFVGWDGNGLDIWNGGLGLGMGLGRNGLVLYKYKGSVPLLTTGVLLCFYACNFVLPGGMWLGLDSSFLGILGTRVLFSVWDVIYLFSWVRWDIKWTGSGMKYEMENGTETIRIARSLS
jgi:hypothetical protein